MIRGKAAVGVSKIGVGVAGDRVEVVAVVGADVDMA
jgi:hypothetical protein